MSLEDFLAEARRLRTAASSAERAFLDFLMEGEAQPAIWQGTGMSFVEFIVHQNLCRAERYLRYKRMRAQHGVIDDVGIEAIMAAGGLADIGSQRAVLQEARVWERTNGTTISEESARLLARDTKQREAGPRGTRHRGYMELLADNERLVAENLRVNEENKALRLELRQLKSKKLSTKTKAKPTKRASA